MSRHPSKPPSREILLSLLSALAISPSPAAGEEEAAPVPQVLDANLKISLFADSDLIRHPIGATIDKNGRLLVVESHTHFRPDGYDGPARDRVIWLRDTDDDGRADKSTVFFSGTEMTMDIATHPETGAIYLATRNEILRLRDRDGDGVADADRTERRLVFLETKGSHPHNGISGLAFDSGGDLHFGMGENLGEPFTIIGADGTKFTDPDEGGDIWRCDRDGNGLRHVATGFWNPFGVCVGPDNDVFATDNDPDSRPPCRLHHVIDGGDYGYLYRYGRSGLHPFISWNGELTGTLPMLAGTGEAPCDIIYQNGRLLVASWSDHRVEAYPLDWNDGRYTTRRVNLIQGGPDFRPVAFAVAPDESVIYLTDWVKRDYSLHKQGRVWKITGTLPVHETGPAAAGRPQEIQSKQSAITALADSNPWRHADAIHQLAGKPELLASIRPSELDTPRQRIAWMLANQRAEPSDPLELVPAFVTDPDPEARLLALKWIADERLGKYRSLVERIISNPDSPVIFHAAVTALARTGGGNVDDKHIQRLVAAKLLDPDSKPDVQRAAFTILSDRNTNLSLKALEKLFRTGNEQMKTDVLLTLLTHPSRNASAFRTRVAADEFQSPRVRAYAAIGADGSSSAPAGSVGGTKRPTAPGDTNAWMNFIAAIPGAPDPDAGRRVFHNPKSGNCAACHRTNGFGGRGGPDLTKINLRGRRHIVESIINPSAEVAPRFEAWNITMDDGAQYTGFLVIERGGAHTYADITGREFTIDSLNLAHREQLPVSLMPPGLAATLTDAELRDLVAYLEKP